MPWKEAVGYLAGLIFLAGFVPYLWKTWKGQAQPSKVSWLIWDLLDWITLAAMVVAGSVNPMMVGAVIGATTTLFFSVRLGVGGWTRMDKFCLVGSVAGLILWVAFNSPTVGIATGGALNLIGAFPTWKTAWVTPEKEDKLAWILFTISCYLTLLSLPKWDFNHFAQPVSFTIIETVVILFLFWPRGRRN